MGAWGAGPLLLPAPPSSVKVLEQKHSTAYSSIIRAATRVILSLKATTTIMRPDIIIEEGYWREPLDPTVALTQHGRFYKHFHQLVRPTLESTIPGVSFHPYTRLPAELRLRILELCDAPTLFQLMRTSYQLRAEAKKVFFSDRKTWYYLPATDLLDGCPAESIYRLDFLACVEQLDLECREDTEDCLTGRVPYLSNWDELPLKIDEREFWQIVRRLFPLVKRVMLSQEARSQVDEDSVARCYRKLAQVCPQDIDVSICAAEKKEDAVGRRRKRICWRLRAGQEDMDADTTLERDEFLKSPLMPVVPPQKAYRGRVGGFLKAEAFAVKFDDQYFARGMHRAAAVEKHYFENRHEPFRCHLANCDAWFEQPGQYTTHLLGTKHSENEISSDHFILKTVFSENSKRLDQLGEDQRASHYRFWNWWGFEDNPERLILVKKKLMDQLEHEALYAQNKPIAEHGLWRRILRNDYYWPKHERSEEEKANPYSHRV
jgi:hypothetical protein